ncbi:MAG: DUF2892 domain-containing protein [Bacteroidia bacterium]|nr:DUF2892 domain-containing protein [Bacteroidia bacterium]
MKKNMGELDKILRVLAAAVVVVLNFMGTIGGTLATVLMSVAAILLLTTLINFCPLYALFKVSTKR